MLMLISRYEDLGFQATRQVMKQTFAVKLEEASISFNEYFSLNLEGNYTSGFGDLDDIQYFHFILGGVIRFDLPHGNHKF